MCHVRSLYRSGLGSSSLVGIRWVAAGARRGGICAPRRPQTPTPHPYTSSDGDAATTTIALSRTIHGALRRYAELDRDRPHVCLREDDGAESVISYGELWRGAARVASGLRAPCARVGETVAIMLPTGFDFRRTFQGILAAGAIAVPLYPPVRLDRLGEYLRRQRGILLHAGARYLVTLPQAETAAPNFAYERCARTIREESPGGSIHPPGGAHSTGRSR